MNKHFHRIHPKTDGKNLSSGKQSVEVPVLEKYLVILHQNAGAPPDCAVNVGDEVKKYQILAEAHGAFSARLHSPTSGEITAKTNVTGAAGKNMEALEITSDGLDDGTPMPELNWRETPVADLLRRIAEAGIVGMGGAAFPAAIKLAPPPDKPVDTLIINGAECEPFLTADHRLMLENPAAMIEGASISAKILGVGKTVIAVENNKPDAIAALQPLARAAGIAVINLKTAYPQGSEKQLIYGVTGRKVPAGGLPCDAGCVVENAGTVKAIYDAVVNGIPLIERIVTVSGDAVKNPGNFKMRIGTPVLKAIEQADGITAEPEKFIIGGPMMGFAQRDFSGSICKNTSGLLLFRRAEAPVPCECLRCGKCVASCPMNLIPAFLASAVESERFDLARQNHAMDCLECGACAYSCPAHRPLVQHLRRAKSEIRKMKK